MGRIEQTYLTHSQALRAAGQLAAADEYLQKAYDRVMLVAGKFTDQELRRSWLKNVIENRMILAEARAHGIKS